LIRAGRYVVGTVGIRKEDKRKYECRAAVSPEQVRDSIARHGLCYLVEPSPIRIFPDAAYAEAGASVQADLSKADVILGVKEIPVDKLAAGMAYAFFSHTVKGQQHNMAMLQRLLDLECTLIDYERIADESGRRKVFFGYHAGLAGMIDSLWILGKRLSDSGVPNPFSSILQAFHYDDLAHACRAVARAGEKLKDGPPLPEQLAPLVVGFAGYGNVSRGAQYVCDFLPVIEIAPEELPALFAPRAEVDRHSVYKVVFKEEQMAERADGGPFALQEYYDSPELYRGIFHRYVPYLSVLVNCIYWESKYPYLVTRKLASELHSAGNLRLLVVGDVTCDIEGSIEMTTKATTQESPILVFNPASGEVTETTEGEGFAVLAVDNLPAELPRNSTRHFGESLFPYLSALANLDCEAGFEELELAPELKRAVIVWNGVLTPGYEYLNQYLKGL